jgi:hypothetical protein
MQGRFCKQYAGKQVSAVNEWFEMTTEGRGWVVREKNGGIIFDNFGETA